MAEDVLVSQLKPGERGVIVDANVFFRKGETLVGETAVRHADKVTIVGRENVFWPEARITVRRGD